MLKDLHKKYQLLLIVLFYLVISIVMYGFYKRSFIWAGDDVYYQFQRIMGLPANYKDGILYSNISPFNFGTFGYGVNIFYPWLTLIPFNIAFLIFGSWISAYYKTMLFYFFASLIISHYSMKRFSGSTRMAIFFAIVYNFSTYRLIEMYTRMALAEYLATIFLPLCFLGFYELFFGDGKQWQPLAIGMSLIILSHILSVFLCLIMFGLIMILFMFKLKFSKVRLINFSKAVIATIGCTLIFTVPFLLEESFQKYGVPDRQILQGQNLQKVIMASLEDNSLQVMSRGTYNIGSILLITIVLGLILFLKLPLLYKNIYITFVLTFILTTDIFPWKVFQNTPIEVIQFPYRFFMFVTLFGTVIMAWILTWIAHKLSYKSFSVMVLLVALVTGGLWMNSISRSSGKRLGNPQAGITEEMIKNNKIIDTYLEQYVPKNSQKMLYTMTKHQININGSSMIQKPKAVGDGNDFYITNVKKGDVIDLPFVRYKYTKAKFNNKQVPIGLSNRGSVQIIAPNNAKSVTIRMSYGNQRLSNIIFLLTVVSWIWVLGSKWFVETYRFYLTKDDMWIEL